MNGDAFAYQNGNGNGNGNGNKSAVAAVKKNISGFFGKLFNISPPQWGRVTECWLITFFFKLGSIIGWTVLTAAFVARFGIAFLPTLFVLNALLIIGSTFLFEHFILRIKREVLMVVMILCGAISLFIASFLYDRSPVAFFALVIFAESVFLAQFNVFIPILVGDRFTPLESQKTFPFVESGETIGGMLGGGVVGLFASRLPVPVFIYIWIAFLACVIFVFVMASYVKAKLPPLPFRTCDSAAIDKIKTKDQIKLVLSSIKKMPFLKSLVLIILFQWVFMNMLEFQYTKSIEQAVTHKQEKTIAYVDSSLVKASILGSGGQDDDTSKQRGAFYVERKLTASQETDLAAQLGSLKSLFYFAALIVQALLASRLITALGVVGSMLLYPIIMLMSLVWMFLKFGFWSALVTRLNFDVTNVVHKNAYFSSHYAFPKFIRDQAAEFLEGIVRPMGTIVGMLCILFLQILFTGKELSMWLHIIMTMVVVFILILTMRLQPKYTKISRDQLFSDLPYPEKLNAIEILAQRGHSDTTAILAKKLAESNGNNGSPQEHRIVRMKLISALGQSQDYEVLPEILEVMSDEDPAMRLEAAHALMNFRDLGDRFYTQAFSRYRTVETLKEIFRNEKSATVRCAIIRVFSLLKQSDVVPFMLSLLKDNSREIRADCIYTLGLFRDPNAAYYVLPFLSDPDPCPRANAIVALWHFEKYRSLLQNQLDRMLQSSDLTEVKAGIFALGEIGLPRRSVLLGYLHSNDVDIQLEAAYALAKCADPIGLQVLLSHHLSGAADDFESFVGFMRRLRPKAKKTAERILENVISEHLEYLMRKYKDSSLLEIDADVLEKLKRLYQLVDQHEELFEIERALEEKNQKIQLQPVFKN